MRVNEQAWDGAIGELYEAVMSPQQWAQSIRTFERLIGSAGCHVLAVDDRDAVLFTLFSAELIAPEAMATYYAHYIHDDPRKQVVDGLPVNLPEQCSRYFDERYVSRSGFYQDWLIPAGARYIAGGALARAAQSRSYACFNRPMGSPDFDATDMQLIGRYLPHLGRALRMYLDRDMLQLREAAHVQALDQQDLGVMALDQARRVLHMNASAEAMVSRSGLLMRLGGRVPCACDLSLAVEAAHRQGLPQAMRLDVKGEPHVVMAWPLAERAHEAGMPPALTDMGARLHTLLLLKKMSPGEQLAPRLLGQLFGLSPAEARLAQALAQGLSVESHAAQCQVSVSTVRTQVRAILGKTGCARQQDLVRMLAALPSM